MADYNINKIQIGNDIYRIYDMHPGSPNIPNNFLSLINTSYSFHEGMPSIGSLFDDIETKLAYLF